MLEKLEDSEDISDDEEFRKARNIHIYEEDATEVMRLETKKQLKDKTGMRSVPEHVLNRETNLLKAEGVKSRRDRGFKHFNKVGYIGHERKEVPRWAVSEDLLKKTKAY